jgi:hypothetical protein
MGRTKTNVALFVGVFLLLAGFAVFLTVDACTARLCAVENGFHINRVTLTTVDYYDGCNWCSTSSLALSAPVGGVIFLSGAISRIHQAMFSN